MVTPRLPPECADCEQRPRVGRSTRCADCRAKHRRANKTASTKRRREQALAAPVVESTVTAVTVDSPVPGLDPEVQKRLLAVERALRPSTAYVEYLHKRVGLTPYLDDLHTAVADLVRALRSGATQRQQT